MIERFAEAVEVGHGGRLVGRVDGGARRERYGARAPDPSYHGGRV